MFEWMMDSQAWMSLITLTALEIVLGIDNIIFLSILSSKLPPEQQVKARQIGLSLAMLIRIGLLFSITWVMQLTNPLFNLFGHGISGRDIILIGGGLFLLAKSTHEIHEKLEGEEEHHASGRKRKVSFSGIIIQILLLDIIFSLDSVITAVGMANQLSIMVLAVVIAVGFMMFFAGAINGFVQRHPTIKILALSFLILIGVMLIAEGFGQHISKGYIYFAMAFSVGVEVINIKVRAKKVKPVELRK